MKKKEKEEDGGWAHVWVQVGACWKWNIFYRLEGAIGWKPHKYWASEMAIWVQGAEPFLLGCTQLKAA